ncbi:multiple sugar transport system permease protein/raffinose/stachyose/melibiose transport system permease protein [Saccharothrix ecbatanensis]|uniref:Multiple sugar transport system permease protein/raffinose/stachyose/melibiose transport system permease protein n=1 Tax=Saccharothrix ecbatanensis TaxID=1105145 RepID=A0A7W9HK24_9PSEU|nr:sugar ABC transporter permease [Saccharothrix ecbatanensis]MBB5803378.1 multiple sugar transport system permease protein/raffinose/stachyose/melibiose transport system permease protein [Saccharothrix ecbatanensis]
MTTTLSRPAPRRRSEPTKRVARRGRVRQSFDLFLMTTPAYLIYGTLFLLPALSTFYYSMTSWNGLTLTADWVGFDNFVKVFDEPAFSRSLVTTGIIAGGATILVNALGLAFALLLRSPGRSSTLYRAIIFAPIVLNEVAVGFLWRAILGHQGALNHALNTFAGVTPIEWLGRENLALVSVVMVIIWQSLGFNIVIFLAGLSRVPAELTEAAMIDGANRRQIFGNVTLPSIAPAVTINVIYTFVGLLHEYARIQALTAGGPAGATTTLSFKIVVDGLQDGLPATASAQAAILSVTTVVLALLVLGYLRRRESSTQ